MLPPSWFWFPFLGDHPSADFSGLTAPAHLRRPALRHCASWNRGSLRADWGAKYQDDSDVYRQPFPEPVLEEPTHRVATNHGCPSRLRRVRWSSGFSFQSPFNCSALQRLTQRFAVQQRGRPPSRRRHVTLCPCGAPVCCNGLLARVRSGAVSGSSGSSQTSLS